MNFYTWYCLYKDKDVRANEVPYDTIAAWEACKKEVLMVLKTHTPSPYNSSEDFRFHSRMLDIVKEIKKL